MFSLELRALLCDFCGEASINSIKDSNDKPKKLSHQKSNFINHWVYWGYLQECVWGVIYKNMDDSKGRCFTENSTPAWAINF